MYGVCVVLRVCSVCVCGFLRIFFVRDSCQTESWTNVAEWARGLVGDVQAGISPYEELISCLFLFNLEGAVILVEG